MNSWQNLKLGEIVSIKTGKIDANKAVENGKYPFFTCAKEISRINDAPYEGKVVLVAGNGDLNVKYYEGKFNAYQRTYFLTSLDEKSALPRYIYFFMEHYLQILRTQSIGTTVKYIKMENLSDAIIPLPSIEEQLKIVELLDNHLSRVDAALAEVKHVKMKAAQFRKSLLQSAFTGNLTGDGTRLMTSYLSTWKIESLDSLINRGIIKLNRGDIISKRDIAAHPGDYPIYSSAKENNGLFGRYGKYMFDEEVITWSIDGGGRLFYREKQKFSVTNVGGILRIIDKSVFDYKFLFYALTNLHSQVVFDWSRKAHPSVIRMVYDKVPIPPLSEQHKIVELLEDHLSRLDISVAIADAMEKQSSSLRRSLLQAAFTGQLTKEVVSV